MSFSAVILAGGKSSRMGRDKAFLETDGQTLLARQVKIVQDAGAAEVFISGRVGVDYSGFGLPVLPDLFPAAGPLAGIHAALAAAKLPLVLVLAVDLVHMNGALLGELVQAGTGLVPRVFGRIEPVAAVYPRAGLTIAKRMLEEKRLAVRDFAHACVKTGLASFVDFPDSAGWLFKNLNSPTDLSCLI
jgi:molybdopterin-guanine dinucleotide biosynthesis protein A